MSSSRSCSDASHVRRALRRLQHARRPRCRRPGTPGAATFRRDDWLRNDRNQLLHDADNGRNPCRGGAIERPKAASTASACRAGFRPCRSASCFCSSSSSRSSSSSSSVSGTTTITRCCRGSPRAATPRPSRAASTQLPDLCTILKTYLSTVKFCFIVWVTTLIIGFTVAYFLAFYMRSLDDADGAVSRLHDPVLDLERDPHDLVDSAARPQRAHQSRADARPSRRHSRSNGCSILRSRSASPSPISSPSSWWCRSSIR